jgi:subtilisin family serine protease
MKNLLAGLLSGAVVVSVIAAPPAVKNPGARAMARNAPAFELVPDPAWREFDRVPNRVFAKFRPDVGENAFAAVLADMDATISSGYRLVPGLFCLETAGDEAAVLESYAGRGDVLEFIEPVYVLEFFDTIPDDSQYSQMYGLERINAPAAWDDHVGVQDFAIAIIDSGSDTGHPDLQENIWVNVDEIAGNGIDDDGNGEIDDVNGYDYYDDDPNPADQNGHGTHTAGTVGARGNNGIGVVGVNWRCSIMPLRVGNQSLSTQAILDSLEYACVNGAKVSNNSYGGGGFSGAFSGLIESAGVNYNHIFCAAAGNGGSNGASYPAAYDLPNVLSVAATDSNDNLASFSQYGSNVDLAAPGVSVLSTTPNNGYSSFSGTSMATPHVAGGVALVYSVLGNPPFQDVIDIILNTVRPVPGLAGLVVTGGVLDVEAALDASFLGPVIDIQTAIPDFMEAGESLNVQVEMNAREDVILDGSRVMRFRSGGGFYESYPLVQVSGDLFEATLPAAVCDSDPQFYFQLESEIVGQVLFPANGGLAPLSFNVGTELIVIEDDLEVSSGWVAGISGDDAATGVWTRVNPNGTAAQPENAASGTFCFVTGQGSPGGSLGENDVDGGTTSLLSPIFDATAIDGGTVSYRRWYSNETGAAPNADTMVIDISNNGGSTWTLVENVNENAGAWVAVSFSIDDFLAPTEEMQLRFRASDLGEGSVVEAGVDLLVYGGVECEDGDVCIADLNGDLVVNGGDIGLLLSQFGGPGSADFDGSGSVNGADLGIMLASWGFCP